MALARLASTALDCSDPAALAAFWAGLIGGEVADPAGHPFCLSTQIPE